MLKWNCFESVDVYSRAGGDGGCVADLYVVWRARSGCGRCALFLVGMPDSTYISGVSVGRMHAVMF